MLVYGDRTRLAQPAAVLAALDARLRTLLALPAGIERHGRLAGALIEMGRLWQGLADAEFEACGQDDPTPLQQSAAAATLALAQALWRSWRGGAAQVDLRPLRSLAARALPAEVRLTTPEGYAFYALYPETYAEAAGACARRPAQVVGLRSIGTSLAAMAAAAVNAGPPLSLRPVGAPFQRELRAGPQLRMALLHTPGDVIVADEGPGLSGSSFGAVGDLLATGGVSEHRVLFLPSHGGEPGPKASDADRRRWRRMRRGLRTFEETVLPRLPGWVEDLTGRALTPPEDLSGGAWRQGAPLPSWTAQERRKFRLRAEGGVFLLKFTGLGDLGRAKLERAEALADAGFCPRPLGSRHGFLVERWLEGRRLTPDFDDRDRLLDRLAAYIAFRTRAFPAGPGNGADLDQLAAMARCNLSEGLGPDAADLCARLDRCLRGAPSPRPIRSDNRMQSWEWVHLPDGRLVKTDAIDHDDAHDLIGCQDPAWDIAGAEAAFDLDRDERRRLRDALTRAGVICDPALLDFCRLAYGAFQLGYWTLAAAQTEGVDAALNGREARRWADRLSRRAPR